MIASASSHAVKIAGKLCAEMGQFVLGSLGRPLPSGPFPSTARPVTWHGSRAFRRCRAVPPSEIRFRR
jgi:hypothetical protein